MMEMIWPRLAWILFYVWLTTVVNLSIKVNTRAWLSARVLTTRRMSSVSSSVADPKRNLKAWPTASISPRRGPRRCTWDRSARHYCLAFLTALVIDRSRFSQPEVYCGNAWCCRIPVSKLVIKGRSSTWGCGSSITMSTVNSPAITKQRLSISLIKYISLLTGLHEVTKRSNFVERPSYSLTRIYR